jgi:hypothetical protein
MFLLLAMFWFCKDESCFLPRSISCFPASYSMQVAGFATGRCFSDCGDSGGLSPVFTFGAFWQFRRSLALSAILAISFRSVLSAFISGKVCLFNFGDFWHFRRFWQSFPSAVSFCLSDRRITR